MSKLESRLDELLAGFEDIEESHRGGEEKGPDARAAQQPRQEASASDETPAAGPTGQKGHDVVGASSDSDQKAP